MAVRTVQKTINPKYAEQILKRGSPNRQLSEVRVQQYARDMLNDQWVLNHQGIAFDDEGALIDGQHRLEAIRRAGVSVDMMVTTGLPKTARNGLVLHVMDTVDRGRPRTVGDQLHLRHGWANCNHVAAYARTCAIICVGGDVRNLSTPQTLLVLKHFGDSIRQTIDDCQTREDRKAGVGGTIAFARTAVPTIGDSFAAAFFSMENLGKNSPIIAARKWIANHTGGAGTDRLLVVKVMASAMQAFSESRTMAKIYAADQGLAWLRKQYAKKIKDVTSHILMPELSADR